MKDLSEMTREELLEELRTLRLSFNKTESPNLSLSNVLCCSFDPSHQITIDSLIEGLWMINEKGVTVFINNTMATMLGYVPAEMIGKHLFRFVDDCNIEQCKRRLKRRKKGIKETYDFTFMHKNDYAVYVRISSSPINDEDRKYVGAVASIVDISDIHCLQKKLQSEFENAPVGIVHMDLQGNMLRVNKAFVKMMEYSSGELTQKHFLDITHPDDREECRGYKERVLSGCAEEKLIKRHITKYELVLWLEVSFSLEHNEYGSPDYIVAYAEDITDQKRSEMVLQARLHLMHYAATNSLNDLLVEIVNEVERLTESSLGFFHFLNADESYVDLRSWSSRTTSESCKIKAPTASYPLSGAGLWADCVRQKKTVIHNDFESIHRTKKFPKGHPPVYRELTTPVIRENWVVAVLGVGNKVADYTEEDARIVELLVDFAWDVAERKRHEEIFIENERKFKSYSDLGLVGLAVTTPQRKWTYFNDKFCELLGYNKDELMKLDVLDFTHPGDVQRTKTNLADLISGAKTHYSFEKRYIKKDGSIINVQVYATSGRKPDGSVEYLMGHILDVTERVKAEKELQEAKEIQDKILEGIGAGIIVVDPETKVIESINSVALKMFKVSENKVLGKTCDVFGWRNVEGKPFSSCPVIGNDVVDMQLRASCFDGSVLPISKTVIITKLKGRDKFFEIVFDTTDRKDLERRLSLAQKMEAIGNLSSGIAHEINTPAQYLGDNIKFLNDSFKSTLDFISLVRESCAKFERVYCSKVEDKFKGEDLDYLLSEIPKAIEQSQDGVQRISSIVKAMKRFAHPGVNLLQNVDINSILKNTVTVCRNEWKYYSKVVFVLDLNLPPVPCFANDISQVFLNIIVNAAHANAEKYAESSELGTILIRTFLDNKNVVIEIEDTGHGIPEELLPKIFDPFFTTKKVGNGTGQGLTLCYSIITEKHKGTIDFSSIVGNGTKCRIELPLYNIGEINEL